MPPWVKRTVIWSPAAEADLLALQNGGHLQDADDAADALDRYATTGKIDGRSLIFFRRNPWRSRWRLKRPNVADSWRMLFVDSPARRLIVVERVRLPAEAYTDPAP